MRVVGLISGGKDSCYNMMQCIAAGHEIVAVASLTPVLDNDMADDPNSFMYQSVGQEAIHLYASALELPLYRQTFDRNAALCLDSDYVPTEGDEVEALYHLLRDVKDKENIDAVSVGAILSNYQRVRVENVCSRLDLTVLAYMWRRDQQELLAEMISTNIKAIVIKVASLGLSPQEHLGKELSEIYPHLLKMHKKYGLNVCGEGGEYETFTLDCPIFKKTIVVEKQATVIQDENDISPVAYIKLTQCHLKSKTYYHSSQQAAIRDSGVYGPMHFLTDLDLNQPSIQSINPLKLTTVTSTSSNNACRPDPSVTYLSNGWIFIGGIVAGVHDISSATSDALNTVTQLLSDNQMSVTHLVSVHLFVSDMNNFGTINGTYKKVFNRNPPCRVCVQVPLPKDMSFVLDCLAYKGPQTVRHMHVQGISHWAPANIGPYSQAVQVDNQTIHVAGQIGLVPGTMQLIEDVTAQSRLSLRHVFRVLHAMTGRPANVARDFLSCICYVTHESYMKVAQDALRFMCDRLGHVHSECCGSVTYTVVSGLPRGAHVEWQVVTKDDRDRTASPVTCEKLDDGTVGGIRIKGTVTANGLTFIDFECSGNADPIEPTVIKDAFIYIDHLVRKRFDLASNRDSQQPNSAYYQVFFDANRANYDQLLDAWMTTIGECRPKGTRGLTLIPTLTIGCSSESVFMNIRIIF